MKIKVNGSEKDVADGVTIEALLGELGIGLKGVAIELNREVVPKRELGSVKLKDNDAIEIIRMVGGG